MPMMPCRGSQGGVGSAAGGKRLGASASHGLCIVSVHWPEDMDAGGAVRQLRGGAEEGDREDGRDLGRINWGARPRGRGPCPPMRKPAGGRAAGGGRRVMLQAARRRGRAAEGGGEAKEMHKFARIRERPDLS